MLDVCDGTYVALQVPCMGERGRHGVFTWGSGLLTQLPPPPVTAPQQVAPCGAARGGASAVQQWQVLRHWQRCSRQPRSVRQLPERAALS